MSSLVHDDANFGPITIAIIEEICSKHGLSHVLCTKQAKNIYKLYEEKQ